MTTLIICLSVIAGFYMAFAIGSNDAANAIGTSYGAKVMKYWHLVLIAAVFEFLGAYFAGGSTTDTIRTGIVRSDLFTVDQLVFGMLASLLSAASWLILSSRCGWPVSTTHAIVGGIVGVSIVIGGVEAVNWVKMLQIVTSWGTSPLIAGLISFFLYLFVKNIILNNNNPLKRSIIFVPFFIFMTGTVISLVVIIKGLKHTSYSLPLTNTLTVSAGIGLLLCLVSFNLIKKTLKRNSVGNPIEVVFSVLMVLTACSMAFAHGSNDVANAVGPVAAIVNTVATGAVSGKSSLPSWTLLIGSLGIVCGLLVYGRKVMITVGNKITALTPSKGFAAEISASTTVVVASIVGMPISTTHTLVGAVLGVGVAGSGFKHLDYKLLRKIIASWIFEIPVVAIGSIGIYYIFLVMFKM